MTRTLFFNSQVLRFCFRFDCNKNFVLANIMLLENVRVSLHHGLSATEIVISTLVNAF